MPDPVSPGEPDSTAAGAPARPRPNVVPKKKKSKVRGAWISFVGRIVAQVVGAVASIVLAVTFLQRRDARETPPAVDTPAAAVATPPAVRPADARTTLAVLPLANFSGDDKQDYFAEGMTEALIADLAQVDNLRVISRTSVMQYRGTQKPMPQIARELAADMIVEGSVVRSGDRVRVTAQLIDAKADHHVWARSYDHTMRDVLSLQGRIASEIAREVRGVLTPMQQSRLAQRKAIDPAAYDLYLRGRHAWNLRTEAGFKAAAAYFEQAIEREPEFALAYAGLADAHVLDNVGGAHVAESRAKAQKAATRALELNDSLAEAHTSRAALLFFQERNPAAAEREFERALALNGGYPTAHQWYAILLSESGRDAEAVRHAQEAVSLDPLSGTMYQTLGLVHYYGRRFPEAVVALRRAIDLAPQLPLARAVLAKTLFKQAAYVEALAAAESVPGPQPPDVLVVKGLSYLRQGDQARAGAILKDLESRSPRPGVALAQWYATVGDVNRAITALQRDATGGFGPAAEVDPMFDGLRGDARFAPLARGGR
jgi:TolB-like protein/tetratricopeptide (TPR) repeat protein